LKYSLLGQFCLQPWVPCSVNFERLFLARIHAKTSGENIPVFTLPSTVIKYTIV
jgi:hypothetical protein